MAKLLWFDFDALFKFIARSITIGQHGQFGHHAEFQLVHRFLQADPRPTIDQPLIDALRILMKELLEGMLTHPFPDEQRIKILRDFLEWAKP